MAVEYYTDKKPMYVHNPRTNYENTVLQEHAEIVRSLKDTGANEALIESQGRLFIGLCIKGDSTRFIQDNYTNYYTEEYNNISDSITGPAKKNVANTRAWLRLMNEAMDRFINKYKVDGSRAKIAIIDNKMPDGRELVEVDEVEFSDHT